MLFMLNDVFGCEMTISRQRSDSIGCVKVDIGITSQMGEHLFLLVAHKFKVELQFISLLGQVTQMKYRLSEGGEECFYYVGEPPKRCIG